MRKYFAFFSPFPEICLNWPGKRHLSAKCASQFHFGRFLSASSISFSPSWKSEPGTFPFFCNLCLCHILKIPKYNQSFSLLLPIFPEFPPEKSGSKSFFMAILFFRKPVHKLQIRSISLIHSLVNRIHLCSRFQRHRQFFHRHIHSI